MAHYRFASFAAHLYTRHLHLQVGQMSFGTEQMGQLSIENIDANSRETFLLKIKTVYNSKHSFLQKVCQIVKSCKNSHAFPIA